MRVRLGRSEPRRTSATAAWQKTRRSRAGAGRRRTAHNSTERKPRSRSERVALPAVTSVSATFVHPTAEVSPAATLGEGCRVWRQSHIREQAVVGAGTIVGAGVYI